MSRAFRFGLAAVLAGIVAGAAVAVLTGQPAEPPEPAPVAADIRPPAASFDPIFEPCAHCHQIGPGARMATGPALQGVIGRKAGTLSGYPFSDAMRRSGLTWNEATLDRFIASPQVEVPGTRMIYAGMDDARQRAALIAFIVKEGKGPR